MLKNIDRVILRVPQLESAVTYYRDVLGLSVSRHDANIASLKLQDGQTELVLHTDDDLPADAVYFLVDDVRDLYRRREELRLKFNGPPTQVSRGYRATVHDPFGNLFLLLDRSTESAGASTIEDAKTPGTLFTGITPKIAAKKELLIKLYVQIGRTADDLPYTPQFETLYSDYIVAQPDPKPTRQETWRHLLNLRKGGKLPKLGEAKSIPPEVDDDAKHRLRQMLGSDIGKRDRLPYTDRFDAIVDAFNKSHTRKISPHLVWRLVATLAK